jgi:succinate dehydrogenase/fumarate reductase-like Fe-S protein
MLFFIFLFIIPLSLSIEIKACVNCKHVIINPNIYYSKCFLFPKIMKENEFEKNKKMLELAVTGIEEIPDHNNFFSCTTARKCNEMCGLIGSKFEKK